MLRQDKARGTGLKTRHYNGESKSRFFASLRMTKLERSTVMEHAAGAEDVLGVEGEF
jgi:hypothetical protein